MMPCRWLSLGIHVIAANKRLGAGPLADYQAVQEAQRKYCTHFLAEVGLFLMMDVMLNREPTPHQYRDIPTYVRLGLPAQATVGAGLPVLSTLRSLLNTGDAVERIEGVLSGTLSFIFNRLSPEQPFSRIVAEAKAAGYTEPDPREDLSGVRS